MHFRNEGTFLGNQRGNDLCHRQHKHCNHEMRDGWSVWLKASLQNTRQSSEILQQLQILKAELLNYKQAKLYLCTFFLFCALAHDGLKINVRWFTSTFKCFRCFTPLVTWEIPQVIEICSIQVLTGWLCWYWEKKPCNSECNPVLHVPPHNGGSTWKHLTAQNLYLMWRKLLTKTVSCRVLLGGCILESSSLRNVVPLMSSYYGGFITVKAGILSRWSLIFLLQEYIEENVQKEG